MKNKFSIIQVSSFLRVTAQSLIYPSRNSHVQVYIMTNTNTVLTLQFTESTYNNSKTEGALSHFKDEETDAEKNISMPLNTQTHPKI